MKKSSFITACLATLLLASSANADDFNPLGDYRVGATAGVGAPSLLSGQLLMKYKEFVGLNAEYGVLPELNLPVGNGVKLSQHMFDFSLHLYPFKGGFFLGGGVGTQTVSATGSTTVSGYTGEVSTEVTTVFLSPRIGYLHKFDSGIALGIDAMLEIPVSGSTNTSTSVGVVPKEVSDVTDKVKTTPVPVIHLLQLGYVF